MDSDAECRDLLEEARKFLGIDGGTLMRFVCIVFFYFYFCGVCA